MLFQILGYVVALIVGIIIGLFIGIGVTHQCSRCLDEEMFY